MDASGRRSDAAPGSGSGASGGRSQLGAGLGGIAGALLGIGRLWSGLFKTQSRPGRPFFVVSLGAKIYIYLGNFRV